MSKMLKSKELVNLVVGAIFCDTCYFHILPSHPPFLINTSGILCSAVVYIVL